MTRNSLPGASRFALVLLLLSLAIPRPEGTTPVRHDAVYEIEVHGGSTEQRLAVHWAAGRFHQAGLDFDLPSIHLHDGTMRCRGNGGFTDILPEGVSVHICIQDETDLRRKLLHEIAHVWDLAHGGTTKRARDEFLALRGLTRWNDLDDEWPERGAEQAAEIVAWGLSESLGPIRTRVGEIGPQDVESLAIAFELLIGVPPLWMGAPSGSTGTWQDV